MFARAIRARPLAIAALSQHSTSGVIASGAGTRAVIEVRVDLINDSSWAPLFSSYFILL